VVLLYSSTVPGTRQFIFRPHASIRIAVLPWIQARACIDAYIMVHCPLNVKHDRHERMVQMELRGYYKSDKVNKNYTGSDW